MRSIDGDELEGGDGVEGRPALVAVEGRVYDVSASRMWADGKHMKAHAAGRDLTLELQAAPHGPEVLERVEQVGELAEPGAPARATQFPEPPALLARVLALHPHPVSVHFPIALCTTAALFVLLALIFGIPSLERAALYNLGLGVLAAPAAILTGLLSWRYNYGGVWTPIFRRKTALSVLLLLLAAVALTLRLALPESFGPEAPLHWVYAVLVLAHAPTVAAIGFLGGNITFPR